MPSFIIPTPAAAAAIAVPVDVKELSSFPGNCDAKEKRL
jgi:hypothetical protein